MNHFAQTNWISFPKSMDCWNHFYK